MMVDKDRVPSEQARGRVDAAIASLDHLDPATTDVVYTVTDRTVSPGRNVQCTVVASATGVEVSVDLFGTATAEASESIDPDTWLQLIGRASELAEYSCGEAHHDDTDTAACTTELAIRSRGRTAFAVTASGDGHDGRRLSQALRTFIDPAIAHIDLPATS